MTYARALAHHFRPHDGAYSMHNSCTASPCRNHFGNQRRRMLQVGIDGDHRIAAGISKPANNAPSFPKFLDRRIPGPASRVCQLRGAFERPVAATVVDHYDFITITDGAEDLREDSDSRLYTRFLVESGDDDAYRLFARAFATVLSNAPIAVPVRRSARLRVRHQGDIVRAEELATAG